MKITQLYDSYQLKGGVERVLSLLLNGWAQQGHDVSLLVRSGQVSSIYPLLPTVSTLSLGQPLHASRARRLFDYARAIRILRKHPAIRDADVVIANGPWCSLLAILALKRSTATQQAPALIVCDHNSPAAFGRLTRAAGRRLYPKADCIIALTQAQQAHYQAFAEAIRVIPNPITPATDKATLPTESEFSAPYRQVLAIGRLTSQKGFDYLLDAWAIVIRQTPDAHLTIVGEGENKEALLSQADRLGLRHSITFSPFSDDVASIYQAASMLVMSSRYEGLALVLLEAQAHALPIVSFDCEFGPREVITHAVDGLLCEPGNVTALSKGLLRLLENDEEREAMSKAALVAAKKYELPGILDQWNKLFVDLAASR